MHTPDVILAAANALVQSGLSPTRVLLSFDMTAIEGQRWKVLVLGTEIGCSR